MTKKEVIEQLRDLIRDREHFIDKDDTDCVFKQDIEALAEAIKLIENSNISDPIKLNRKYQKLLLENKRLTEIVINAAEKAVK